MEKFRSELVEGWNLVKSSFNQRDRNNFHLGLQTTRIDLMDRIIAHIMDENQEIEVQFNEVFVRRMVIRRKNVLFIQMQNTVKLQRKQKKHS